MCICPAGGLKMLGVEALLLVLLADSRVVM